MGELILLLRVLRAAAGVYAVIALPGFILMFPFDEATLGPIAYAAKPYAMAPVYAAIYFGLRALINVLHRKRAGSGVLLKSVWSL